jgi:hypothetical protein
MCLKEKPLFLANRKISAKFYFWIAKKCNFLFYLTKHNYQILLINTSLKMSYSNSHKKCWRLVYSITTLDLRITSCLSHSLVMKLSFYQEASILTSIMYPMKLFILKWLQLQTNSLK